MSGIAEAQFTACHAIGCGNTEQFKAGYKTDCNDRPSLGVGHELPGFAFKFKSFPQAPPFKPIGVFHEDRQDTRPFPCQAGWRKPARRRRMAIATSFSCPARAAMTKMPAPEVVTDK